MREASGGLAEMDLLAAHADIDLLFTDIIMPGGMNGVELANEALSDSRARTDLA